MNESSKRKGIRIFTAEIAEHAEFRMTESKRPRRTRGKAGPFPTLSGRPKMARAF
jgi:hypothetical protein